MPCDDSATDIVSFHRDLAAEWTRLDETIRQLLRRRHVDRASIEVIASHMHQHLVGSGMASCSRAPEDVIAALFLRVLELETQQHSVP